MAAFATPCDALFGDSHSRSLVTGGLVEQYIVTNLFKGKESLRLGSNYISFR